MRLLTFIHQGQSRLGVLVGDDTVLDVAAAQEAATRQPVELDTLQEVIEAGPAAWEQLAADIRAFDLKGDGLSSFLHGLADLLLAPPIRPSKICAIGLNYLDHVLEGGRKPPSRPVLFAKYPTSVIGPDDAIRWDPALSDKIDYEAELAVVVGKPAYRVAAADAMSYVFGYTCANDVTARDIQQDDGQWVRGKSLDTFCPLGPWIVTADEIADPHDLPIRCTVNGQTMQSSNTDQLIFRIPALIEFLSHSFTLLPGDIILTGTPPGVGHYANPPHYLRDGDIVTIEIDGIGKLRNVCRVDKVVK